MVSKLRLSGDMHKWTTFGCPFRQPRCPMKDNQGERGRRGKTIWELLRIRQRTSRTKIENLPSSASVRRRSAGQKGRQCFRVLPSGKHGGRDCPNQQDRFGQISAQGTRIIVEGQKCTILFLLRQNLVITSDDVRKGHWIILSNLYSCSFSTFSCHGLDIRRLTNTWTWSTHHLRNSYVEGNE